MVQLSKKKYVSPRVFWYFSYRTEVYQLGHQSCPLQTAEAS